MTRSQNLTFEKHQWRIVPEQDIENVDKDGKGVAELFLQHGGLLLSAAGVGKS